MSIDVIQVDSLFVIMWYLYYQPSLGPLFVYFFLFQTLFHNKNWRLKLDLNLDHRNRRWARWPLDLHYDHYIFLCLCNHDPYLFKLFGSTIENSLLGEVSLYNWSPVLQAWIQLLLHHIQIIAYFLLLVKSNLVKIDSSCTVILLQWWVSSGSTFPAWCLHQQSFFYSLSAPISHVHFHLISYSIFIFLSWLPYSVTRYGEILPLWQKFTSLWQMFNGLYLIWQNTQPTLANLWHYWTNFHCSKWPNLEK